MLFNSIDFLFFFPIVVLIYLIIPKKIRTIWLLISSYYFYMSWNPIYSILILTSTIITYIGGIFIDKFAGTTSKKLVLLLSIISNLSILAIFKYYNFFIHNINVFFEHFNISTNIPKLDLLLPVGISFYTFQALSYTIDVYRNKINAEYNFVNYALFVSFFPQLVAGPIERSNNLLNQIKNIYNSYLLDFNRIYDGLLLMLWGLFQKIVIADRASIYVNKVFNNYTQYNSSSLMLAAFLFAIQIYCDFSGYTNIARGSAKIMNFSLMENFNRPYFARNIHDFWRRWHISLTSWFTDYLYIPLGGNRRGILRKYINILIVFTISGLWHGAGWNFLVWGGLHAIYQISEGIIQQITSKIIFFKNKISNNYPNPIKIAITFIFVDIAWIFFANDKVSDAIQIIRKIFEFKFITINNNYEILSKPNIIILIISIMILFIIDFLCEINFSIKVILTQNIITKFLTILIMSWILIMFGIYGVNYDVSQFIYFQF